ncbi:MAG TPA: glycosyltransferase family 4 protein [Gemmataceae bacterium]|nr:glycosyltransferase family 4 protein [Gemmataceae bacterium]
MRLTALVESFDHVCCRYRLAAFRSVLEQAGHRLELRPWPRRWCSWLRLERTLRSADAVILQRKLLATWNLYLLRRAARILLFDFDDAIFLRDSYSPKGLHSLRRLQRFAATAEMADVIIAGNSYLRDQASRWSSAERIHVIPTCVDPAPYRLAEHVRAGQGVELVWIGSSSTLRGLEMIRPVLEMLGQPSRARLAAVRRTARFCEPPLNSSGLRLKLVCDRFLHLENLPVVCCPWSEANEAESLAEADIGISWMPDDLWSRGKCGLKVLQYMAAGLPVIANPVGIQAELVRHGETGFLVHTAAQWLEAVRRLAHDPLLRRRMGRAGRRRVEAEFSVTAGATRWLGLLDGFKSRRLAA